MKTDIHPKYFPTAQVKCACGNTFVVGSTQESLEVEICSACHPFYTGKANIVDKMGQIQKFKNRLAKKQEPKVKKARVKKDEKEEGSKKL